ncbi:MAG: hypothetical protein M3Q79_03640 [bacterium]|nr:hypothetical protein [bacterium]
MSKTVFFGLLVLVISLLQLQYFATQANAAPSTLNFQARLKNSSGGLVPDGLYNIEFKIYDSAAAGQSGQGSCSLASTTDDCWWQETRTGGNQVQVKNGYLSANLGSVTSFGSVPWSSDLWLSMNIGGLGVPVWDGEMSPRIKLTAVPYAFEADKIDGIDSSGLAQLAPSASQVVNSALSAIAVNQTGSGSLLDLRGNGSTVFSLDKNGNASLAAGLTLGNSSSTTAGTLRWTGTDFEGYDGSQWKSLSGGVVIPFVSKTKTIDETQNSVVNPTATLQNDDQLFFSVGANETWNFRFTLHANANATPDIKFAVTAPSGAICKVGTVDPEGATSVANLGCGVSTGLINGNSTEDIYEVTGSITNGSTSGVVTLQWAQNTANAANVIVRQGSFVEATRSVGGSSAAVAYIQNGNSFGATAVLGTNDNNGLSFITNGTEKLTLTASGNFGVGDTTPAALFTVGTSDAFQVNASGNVQTPGTLNIGGLSTFTNSIVGSNSATATTGTTLGAGTNTTTLTLAADSFAVGDVVLIDNAAQDYFTRITVDPGTGSYTVSTASDYTTTANRFFQGYFLGGVVVGAGSTTLSDGVLESSETLYLQQNGQDLSIGGDVNISGVLSGDGSGLTNLSGASVDGATVTGLSASNIASGTIGDTYLSSNVALLTNSQTFSGLKTFGAGLTISSGQNLNINSESFADLTGNGLSISGSALNVTYGSTANTAVQGNTTLTCPSGTGNLSGGGDSITLGSGGSCSAISITNSPAFTTSVTSPNFTGSGAVTLSSGGAGGLTLNSASNTLTIDATDTMLQRIASGTYTMDFSDSSDTTLQLNNSGTGVLNLNLNDGALQTAGSTRLTSGGVLQNITGLTITSGGASITGDTTFVNNVLANGNTTIGNATTDRLTISAQLLNQDALVFQGVTDNGFASTLRITDPSANRIVTLADEEGTICLRDSLNCGFVLIGKASAQADSSTNASIFINKTGASGNILTLQKNGSGVFTIANNGAVAISLSSTSAFNVTDGSVSYFNVDTSGALVRVGSATADGVGALLVLDTKNTTGDPTGINGGQYYNSFTNKFRCYENGVWKDCISTTSVRSFIDTVSDAAIDGNTTNYWDIGAENNNQTPNIVLSQANGKAIYGVVTMEVTSTGNNDTEISSRIERGIGSVPTCNAGTQVGGNPGIFTTNTGAVKSSTVTFLDIPNTTSTVYYVLCSDATTAGTTANITRIRMTLQEVNNSN